MALQYIRDEFKLIQTAGETYIGDNGDQTFIINPNLIKSGDTITIIDQGGNNKIQFVDGIEITQSIVVDGETLLTLSNGAMINIRGADTFTFNIGGDAVNGVEGVDKDFNSFAEEVLGTSVPAEGEPAVITQPNTLINSELVNNIANNTSDVNYTQVALTENMVGQDGIAEEFIYQVDSSNGTISSLAGGDIELSGFTVGEDILTFVDADGKAISSETLMEQVTVSASPINNKTEIYFDQDSDGNSYHLDILGVVDNTLSKIGSTVTVEDSDDQAYLDYQLQGENKVLLTEDRVGQDGVAEEFIYMIDSSKGSVSSLIKEDIELKGFTVGEDTLTFVDVENGTVTTETFEDEIIIASSDINQTTTLYFDEDIDGNSYELSIVGIVDDTLEDMGVSIVQD